MHVRIRTHARKHGDQASVCVRTPLQQCGRPRHLRGAVSTLNLNKAERLERRWRGASLAPRPPRVRLRLCGPSPGGGAPQLGPDSL